MQTKEGSIKQNGEELGTDIADRLKKCCVSELKNLAVSIFLLLNVFLVQTFPYPKSDNWCLNSLIQFVSSVLVLSIGTSSGGLSGKTFGFSSRDQRFKSSWDHRLGTLYPNHFVIYQGYKTDGNLQFRIH